ncbi:17415_t:CDS:2, partial [Acaulospora morrowiae]
FYPGHVNTKGKGHNNLESSPSLNTTDIKKNHQYPTYPYNDTSFAFGDENYVAWGSDHQVPVSKEEIENIFIDLANKFGFQKESMRNMYVHLMCMLDSRASRMPPSQALLTLHADYIGGENVNYRKWYFATRMDMDDDLADARSGKYTPDLKGDNLKEKWNQRMNQMSHECLCFLFKLADDYAKSPDCKSKVQPIPEGEYLRSIVTPLYRYIRDQGYEVIGKKFVKREKDHAETIGYDDINQLFWYPERLHHIHGK